MVNLWHEFILRNEIGYVEIIQNDMFNYAYYICYPFKFNGTVEFEMKNIKLRITKLSNTEKGEIRIYLRQIEKDWDIVINEGKKSIIVNKNFKQVFFSDLEIEILFGDV